MSQPSVQLASTDEDEEVRIYMTSLYHSKPCPDLLNGSRKDYITTGIPLYEASVKGDWITAKEILDTRPELVRYSITEKGETALHVAASAESTKQMEVFVEHLLTYMEKKDLELQDASCNTALCVVAASGNLKMVKMMVKRNMALPEIAGSQGMMPLHMAALFGNYGVVAYLYHNSKKLSSDFWTLFSRGQLLLRCVETDMFDIALQIIKDRPELGSSGDVLGVLARKTHAFSETKSNIIMSTIKWVICLRAGVYEEKSKAQAFQLLTIIWQNIAEKPKDEIDAIIRGPPDPIKQDDKPASDKEDQSLQLQKLLSDNIVIMQKTIEPATTISNNPYVPLRGFVARKYSSQMLFVAAEMGNTRFVIELIRLYPDLIWQVNDKNHSIFHTAAEHRRTGIYNLLYEIGSKKEQIVLMKDTNDNNMLHLVGKCAREKHYKDVSGAASEMQLELLWYTEVEGMVPQAYLEEKNKDGLIPIELFTKEHQELVKQGEEWMKGTASQCMVVAALIATIVFAAAFTVPGGYNQNDGIPIFYRKATFMVFVVADAISLFSSSASILMFLSILTSRYAQIDFLKSLPRKLLLGLTTLFLSITTMMVAFSVSFFVLYHKDLIWIPLLVATFAAMPVLLFATLQFPLLKGVYSSTYGARYLFRPKKRALYESRQRFRFALPFISRCTSKIRKLL